MIMCVSDETYTHQQRHSLIAISRRINARRKKNIFFVEKRQENEQTNNCMERKRALQICATNEMFNVHWEIVWAPLAAHVIYILNLLLLSLALVKPNRQFHALCALFDSIAQLQQMDTLNRFYDISFFIIFNFFWRIKAFHSLDSKSECLFTFHTSIRIRVHLRLLNLVHRKNFINIFFSLLLLLCTRIVKFTHITKCTTIKLDTTTQTNRYTYTQVLQEPDETIYTYGYNSRYGARSRT